MNIGDYVRTKYGIAKIEEIEKDKKDTILTCDTGLTIDYITKDFTEEEIIKMYNIKSSPIDLIEVGDIITLKNLNGVYRVCDVSNGKIELDYQGELGAVIINNSSDIKSIVTHEQFSSMEYRIGDK